MWNYQRVVKTQDEGKQKGPYHTLPFKINWWVSGMCWPSNFLRPEWVTNESPDWVSDPGKIPSFKLHKIPLNPIETHWNLIKPHWILFNPIESHSTLSSIPCNPINQPTKTWGQHISGNQTWFAGKSTIYILRLFSQLETSVYRWLSRQEASIYSRCSLMFSWYS